MPDVVREEVEPEKVEEEGAEEKEGVGAGETLIAALDGDEAEEGKP